MVCFLIRLPQFLTLLRSETLMFGKGGELSSGAFFSGSEVGLFGGVNYQLEHLPLAVQLEYNPDQYELAKEQRQCISNQEPLECRSQLGGAARY